MALEISEYEEFGLTVYKLNGRIDTDGVDILKHTLRAGVAAGKYKMILEMSHVNYINSAGLRVLAEIVTDTQHNGGDLRLVGLNERVRRVFEIIGFVQFFGIYDTVVEAMNGF